MKPLRAYADSSFLVAAYSPEEDSLKALAYLQKATESLPFTPLHRHEVRNAIRLRVFRGEVTADQRKQALQEMESDLSDGTLIHQPIPWTDVFREAEELGEAHTETFGTRGIDLLHVGLARVLKAVEFLSFDTRQAVLAEAAGLRVRP
jgi:predicted nucleic acid-binding protein